MKPRLWLPAAAALPLILAAALAENAAATLLPGDTLHGNIVAPGDADSLTIYLPGGSLISVDVLPEKGSALLPDLEVVDPEGGTLDLEGEKEPGPGGVGVRLKATPIDTEAGGDYTFRVIGSGATSGKYLFRCTAKMPRKYAGTPTIGQGAFGGIDFDAPAGSSLRWVVRTTETGAGVSMRSLRDPDGGEQDLDPDAFSVKGVDLDRDGTWSLSVNNDGSAPTEVSFVLSLAIPKASKRHLYLSPLGFGPAPRILSVTPSKVIDDRTVEGVQILGEGFDPDATVRLERKDEDPLEPTSFEIVDTASATADFDPQGASTGAWTLVVENPSGGRGLRKFIIQSAGQVKLPPGVIEGAEVWWVEFDRTAFRDDLALMGLGSTDTTTAALAEAAVKSYALYWARVAFGNGGGTGKIGEGAVPVCFILGEPPSTVGTPGSGFNRVRVGGTAAPTDGSSNPNYPWGDGPLDTGNASYDDLSEDGGAGRGLRTRALQPTVSGSTAGWNAALKPLLDNPLTASDAVWFSTSVSIPDAAAGARYRAVVAAVEAAGQEIGGTLAHFAGRSMGTADGVSGIAAVPTLVGEYAGLVNFSFTGGELLAMAGQVRPGLPGRSKTLHADYFPVRETRPYLMTAALTGQAFSEDFLLAGGRPGRVPGDVRFDGVTGFLPPNYSISNAGTVSGTAPLRDANNNLVGGVYKFLVRWRDTVSGDELLFAHRINLLVDTANPSLSPAEVALGTQLNTQTVNAP